MVRPVKKQKSGLGSESGQGIVEYVLLLVVVVTLVIALANRFFKPFQKWTQFWLGDYVECLLDQGELPSLGGEGSTVSDCDPTEHFSDGGRGGSGGSGGDGDGEGEGSESAEEKANRESEQAKNSRSSGAGRVVTGPRGGSRVIRIGGMDSGSGGSGVVAEAENRAAAKDKSDRGRGSRRFGSGFRVAQGRVVRVSGISGLLEYERAKIKKREQKVHKVAKVDEEQLDEASQKAKKIAFKQTQRKAASREMEMETFSFGKLFRVLLIIVIAIALFLFVAGQLVQISKNMEK